MPAKHKHMNTPRVQWFAHVYINTFRIFLIRFVWDMILFITRYFLSEWHFVAQRALLTFFNGRNFGEHRFIWQKHAHHFKIQSNTRSFNLKRIHFNFLLRQFQKFTFHSDGEWPKRSETDHCFVKKMMMFTWALPKIKFTLFISQKYKKDFNKRKGTRKGEQRKITWKEHKAKEGIIELP